MKVAAAKYLPVVPAMPMAMVDVPRVAEAFMMPKAKDSPAGMRHSWMVLAMSWVFRVIEAR